MGSGSNKVSARVYPWHDLGWDLALADGMVPAQIETRFAANNLEGIDNCDMQAREAASIQDDINTDISTHLWRDILEGKVPVRKANGNPLRGESKQFKWRGPDTPHLTVAEGNEWLTKNRYLQVWAPAVLKNPNDAQDHSASASDDAAPVPNWRHRVQAEAYEHWLRLRASGCNPSVHSICDDMAKWCVQKDIKGDKNQDPKAGTIRNTVLGAGHWTPPPHTVEQAKQYVAQTAQTKVAHREK